MKLLFICGSLERGCNGVGDYTRILAAQLMRLGHGVRMLALHDYAVSGRVEEVQDDIVCCRLSPELSWADRTRFLISAIARFQPDIISLQFVPFSFERRGLPLGILWCLQRVVRANPRSRWHFMFHETWVGFTRIAAFRDRLWGGLQGYIIKLLLSIIKPVVIHTSNPLYIEVLRRAGISAERLPLFSNFSGIEADDLWMTDRLREIGIQSDNRSQYHLVGFLGSCYPDFPLDAAIMAEGKLAQEMGRRLVVMGVGGGVGTGAGFVKKVQGYSLDAIVVHWGRQPAANVVAFLKALDVGLPTSPRQLLGKSGAAAAMHLAGLTIRVYGKMLYPDYNELIANSTPIDKLFLPLESVAAAFCCSLAEG